MPLAAHVETKPCPRVKPSVDRLRLHHATAGSYDALSPLMPVECRRGLDRMRCDADGKSGRAVDGRLRHNGRVVLRVRRDKVEWVAVAAVLGIFNGVSAGRELLADSWAAYDYFRTAIVVFAAVYVLKSLNTMRGGWSPMTVDDGGVSTGRAGSRGPTSSGWPSRTARSSCSRDSDTASRNSR